MEPLANPLELLYSYYHFIDGESETQRGTQLANGGAAMNSDGLSGFDPHFDLYAIPPLGRKVLGLVFNFFLFFPFSVPYCSLTCFSHIILPCL